jgi:hypothetical protein
MLTLHRSFKLSLRVPAYIGGRERAVTNNKPQAILLLVLVAGLTGCSGSALPQSPSAPSASSPLTGAPPVTNPSTPAVTSAPANPDALVVFREPSGFSTSDVYDAHERIVQFTNGGDLIWTADGTHLHGYAVASDSAYWGPPTYFISGKICDEFCVFSIRFGTRDGQRRAYLTVDYGHWNPGTLVDAEVTGGTLTVAQTVLFPPGTPTLSGVVTEMTPAGEAPVEGVGVHVGVPAGWQDATTDQNGFYRIDGLIDGTSDLVVGKIGYEKISRQLSLNGDAILDFQLLRRSGR